MLKTLLQSPGIPSQNVTVFIDGFFDEPRDVAQLFNIKAIQCTPHGAEHARISQHYYRSITATFESFPKSEYIILIEEDLDVSPDFFNYFKQTMHLLDEDPTIYCISAWNDQGFWHSSNDSTLLYRIETMPGLGWMMKRSLFTDELQPRWPPVDKNLGWDTWMRTNKIRKDRECIIPDVSRTYHFGNKGMHIDTYIQNRYFQNHSIQAEPYVTLKDVNRMKSKDYELLMEDLIKNAEVLDHSKDPCSDDFIPKIEAQTFVMFIHMDNATDFRTWSKLAKCYKLWDTDARGFHKFYQEVMHPRTYQNVTMPVIGHLLDVGSMWRQFHHGKHLITVGVPASPYAKYMPSSVKPIYFERKTIGRKEDEVNSTC